MSSPAFARAVLWSRRNGCQANTAVIISCLARMAEANTELFAWAAVAFHGAGRQEVGKLPTHW